MERWPRMRKVACTNLGRDSSKCPIPLRNARQYVWMLKVPNDNIELILCWVSVRSASGVPFFDYRNDGLIYFSKVFLVCFVVWR